MRGLARHVLVRGALVQRDVCVLDVAAPAGEHLTHGARRTELRALRLVARAALLCEDLDLLAAELQQDDMKNMPHGTQHPSPQAASGFDQAIVDEFDPDTGM